MAPHDIQRIRITIRSRITEALADRGWDEKVAAEEIGVKPVTILRWTDETRGDKSTPSLAAASVAADALGVTLDWLVGNELTPAQTVAAVAGRVERETETMRLRLDELLADLAAARRALVTSARKDPKVPKAAGRGGRKRRGKGTQQLGESVAVPGEAAS